MGKKKHASARVCAAGSSGSKEIENLKTRNEQLEKEMAESRKQIEQLRLELELASQTAEQDILADMERDVIRLVISSVLAEATSHENTEMAAVIKKAESAAAELNAAKMRLFSLDGEKNEIQKEMKLIVEERDSRLRSSEQKRKSANPPEPEHGERIWRKWIYLVTAAAASFFIGTVSVILLCSKNYILRT